MRLISVLLFLSFCFGALTSTTPDLTYEEALKHAAVLADSWTAQQKLIYDLADRIKPDRQRGVRKQESGRAG